jgi:hypothetical protein
MNTKQIHFVALVVIAGALVLSACTPGSGDADRLRGVAQQPTPLAVATGMPDISTEMPTPSPAPTETPDISAEMQPLAPALVIEVTREVEVTRIVEVIATPPPAQLVAGIDESAQPCPVKYWRRGRCVATQAQLEAYASEAQP